MIDLLPKLNDEQVLGLAAMMGLHDPDAPEEPELNHINVALPQHQGVPFASLPEEVRHAEILDQLAIESGLESVPRQEQYRAMLTDLLFNLGVEMGTEATTADSEGMVVQALLSLVTRTLEPERQQILVDLVETTAQAMALEAEGPVLHLLVTKKATGLWIFIAAAVLLPAFAMLGNRRFVLKKFSELADPVTRHIVGLGWDKLGLKNLAKTTRPNYRHLIPVILFAAAERSRLG